MEHDEWRYSLSFRPPKKGRNKAPPEIVITLSKARVQELAELLTQPHIPGRFGVEQYLARPSVFEFEGYGQECFDFVSERRFGFGRCGVLDEQEDEYLLRFPLTEGKLPETALTLSAIFRGLLSFDDAGKTNRRQLLSIDMWCNPEKGLHSHPVYGDVHPSAFTWLTKVAAEGQEVSMYGHRALPETIRVAMRQAWTAIAPSNLKRYADECNAVTSDDGRFQLSCFGNACDVSIYPDGFFGTNSDFPTHFDCHNLDSPFQQVTFIAGLARMHELMERSLE